ncbi:hypothetical protein [Aquirhabdus parva]|uniref:Glycosyltransferase family 1 protein n=1 Tax=Aquirhabdus parva TaxID=2283318 RepID=A0A345P7Y4_9GAMM|nr:hypothetical protein [Aquirhabdus parva]AXI03393.1 hypothetical protein HYN46_11400 [Aquirhabdus parva]
MREQKIHLTSYFNPHFITDEMLTFYHALKDYGFNHVHFEPCTIDPDAINILFCGFNLGHDLQKSLRLDRPIDRIIVRNLEPAFPTGPCMFPSYFNLMKNNPVWDYAAGNIARLQAAGIDQVEYVPVTYMPVLERIPTTVEQDIDVYFYGYLSPRRQHIVDQLIARGLKVHVNEFGSSAAYSDLDRLIARSKVILNMTNYDQYHIFEIVRAALPLANHKVVVTELNSYSEIDDDLKDAVLHCPYDQLVDFCVSVVANPELRLQYEKQGYDIFKKRAGAPIVGQAMERYLAQAEHPIQIVKPSPLLPKQLRLGSGTRWSFDVFNIDHDPNVRSDLTLNIGKDIDFSQQYHSWRFGNIKLPESYFDTIHADQVLQSVDDLIIALKNCGYMLAEGGTIDINVPYYLAVQAWRDPKTKRAFNEQSFAFLEQYQFDVAGKKFKLNVDNLVHIMESFGISLHTEQQMELPELSRTPNAITSLRIKLSKQYIVEKNDPNPVAHLDQIFQRGRYYYD